MNRKRLQRDQGRRAMALPLVLVCLAIAMLLGATLINGVLLNYRRTRSAEQQVQALWLADSGVQRARYMLEESPEYRGEVWKVAAADLGGSAAAVVTIEIVRDEEDQTKQTIVIEAVYPNDGQHRAVEHRELIVRRG